MSSQNKISRFFILLAFVIGGFLLAKNVLALDVGTNEITNVIQLSSDSPISIAARIINVAMMFLGIIAVGIVIFAGFKWMTSNGNEENIEAAKKILKAGVIGLVIVLASWGIAAFILNRLLGATGNGGNGGDDTGGGGILPPCSGAGCEGMACDDLPLVPGCNYSSSSCQVGLACAEDSCTCKPCPVSDPNCATDSGGNFGDACDSDLTNTTCDADNNLCNSAQGLTCDVNSCTCLGSPVITDVSPLGGFCEDNVDQTCSVDGDCDGGVCNVDAPNGSANNIISIHGYNFGSLSTTTVLNNKSVGLIARIKQFFNFKVSKTEAAGLSQVIFLGDENDPTDDKVAVSPSVINPACIDSWTNNEIIVAIPSDVVSGPIKVVNGNLNSNLIDFDITNNDIGTQIPNFVSNAITRPGICRITPVSGTLGSEVNYFGNNLNGEGYFGNQTNSFKGINSNFGSDQTSGVVLVPNVGAGYMSTFVVSYDNQKSNYVGFRKNQEPPAPPSISSFEPVEGNVGQYVTIHGSGFGNSRGISQVFLDTTEASYSFPAACLNSVWQDNQVIIKIPQLPSTPPNPNNPITGERVPNVGFKISMKIGAWDPISSIENFKFNPNSSLLPSLCKAEPNRGPASSQVSLYGEYFTPSHGAGTGVAKFYKERSASGPVTINTSDNNANKLVVNVPQEAITGPVRVTVPYGTGNGLNFLVGSCTKNSECSSGTPYCCPFGSPKQGQCAISLMSSTNGCYNSIATSVFEWKFGTSLALSCDNNEGDASCNADDSICNDINLRCNTSSCTCEPCPEDDPQCGEESFYSCAQKGGGDSCPTGFCPNSPGQCSPYAGGVSQVVGTCQEDCGNILACAGGRCNYDPRINKCVKNNNTACSLPESYSYTLGSSSYTAQRSCVAGSWVMTVSSSCPAGWVNIGRNKCRSIESCVNCDAGFDCNSEHQCVNNSVICPVGSTCQGDKCTKEDVASCACCCEKGQDARDCCAPLTCEGTCGSGAANLGLCSGCSVVGNTQEENDAACNCEQSSGRFCKDNTCVDCTNLSQGDCSTHATSCCWDGKDNICRGGDGLAMYRQLDPLTPTSTSPFYGRCAFYACASSASNQCASTPGLYNASSTNILANFIFKNNNQCTGCTTSDPNAACSTLTEGACKSNSSCCWNMKLTGLMKCISGNNKITSGSDTGACAYYNCQGGLNSDQCDSSVPSATGVYSSLSACSAGCGTPSLGASCNSTSTGSGTGTCNVSICGGPFSCLTNSFQTIYSTSSASGGCGTCCCDPNNDTCGQISPVLSCYKDKGNCTGAGRGLCCGCSSDNQCGDVNTLGCSSDSCCHARPEVTATNPSYDQQNVCRNSVISVTFNEKMDNTSLTDNFVLLFQSNSPGTCPAGSFPHSDLGKENSQLNIFARVYNRIVRLFERVYDRVARILNPNQATAYDVDITATYCTAPGTVTYETTGSNTVLKFTPANVLEPNTDYIAIVRGQFYLDSMASSTAIGKEGVLNSYKIGMAGSSPFNGGGYYGPFGFGHTYEEGMFLNSSIWSFKTMDDNGATSGLCLIDKVDLTPASYLFQKNTSDDINENDGVSSDPTFDTASDRDKLYTARALSSNGQELRPLPIYDWSWNWTINDTGKINFASVNDLPANGNRRLLSVQPGILDAQVAVSAKTVMNANNVYSTASKEKEVPSRIFVCANPWPSVINNYYWEPSKDLAGNNYGNYSYEFYYCRDAGDPNTTADDLPAISSGSDIINLGLSDRNVCSNNRDLECTSNNDCTVGGFCIPDILKESYFFQQ